MSEEKAKIFLSYAHVDLGYAKKIYDDLKRYGLQVWFDKESLLPGQDWEKEIKKAIRGSDYFIALLSDKCLAKKGFVHYELRFSFEIIERYFPPDSGIFIIPVRLDECKPSDAYERLGKIHWIDVFPKSEYQNGLRKILQVVSPGAFLLRNKPMELTPQEVIEMIRLHGFYDSNKNPEGKGFSHQYKLQRLKGTKVVFDEISCLMWQQSGSSKRMYFKEVEKYIGELNEQLFAGFNDWRLPTSEEAMSLMESQKNKERLYIDPIFDSEQYWIWTSDLAKPVKGEPRAAWVVYFDGGDCGSYYFNYGHLSVRAVRSG